MEDVFVFVVRLFSFDVIDVDGLVEYNVVVAVGAVVVDIRYFKVIVVIIGILTRRHVDGFGRLERRRLDDGVRQYGARYARVIRKEYVVDPGKVLEGV